MCKIICGLVQAMDEPNSNYNTDNGGVINKLTIILDLLKASHDEQYVLKDKINNLIANPEKINECFK